MAFWYVGILFGFWMFLAYMMCNLKPGQTNSPKSSKRIKVHQVLRLLPGLFVPLRYPPLVSLGHSNPGLTTCNSYRNLLCNLLCNRRSSTFETRWSTAPGHHEKLPLLGIFLGTSWYFSPGSSSLPGSSWLLLRFLRVRELHDREHSLLLSQNDLMPAVVVLQAF